MKSKKILVWFRNDLRLHDNEMLVEAIAKSDDLLPVYIFDPRNFEATEQHTYKSGAIRTQFLLESVADLRASFQQLGGDLLVLQGLPEALLPELVEQYDIAEVFHHREVALEDTRVSDAVEERLWKMKINLRHFIGHTLYNKEDLPFPIKDIPDVFTQFKKKTERDALVKACFLAPEVISFVAAEDWGRLPGLPDLISNMDMGLSHGEFYGGEQEGLKHLKAILAEGSAIYNKLNKQVPGRSLFSSKLSPWLALGCLSPRMVYWLVKDAEEQYGSNPNFSQILLGLLWRDYFRFMLKKHGSYFFNTLAMASEQRADTENQMDLLGQWKTAATGNAVVDKYMAILNQTGYIPQDGRILVAIYLMYVLKVDWVNGAAYFEERSIDYAPANNWCNWALLAGGAKNIGLKKSSFDLEKQFKILNVPIPETVL